MNQCNASIRATLNEFLRISAPEAVTLRLQKQSVNVHELLEEIQAAAPGWLQGKPVTLHLNVESRPLDALLDKVVITKAIRTLLSIALKYAGSSLAITLSVRQVLSLVVFSVIYWGAGIPKEEIASLNLDPKLRLRAGEKMSALESELTYVREAVQAHLGHIWAEHVWAEEDAGEFTCFSFILPVTE